MLKKGRDVNFYSRGSGKKQVTDRRIYARIMVLIGLRVNMRTVEHRIWTVSLCLVLAFIYSCGSDEGQDAYTQSFQENSSNLNMRGKPLQKTSPEDIARMQADLYYLGYDPGPADGTYDPQTRRAIKRFQEEHGLHTDGSVGPLTEQAILKAIHARTNLQKDTPSSVKSRQESNQ